MWGTVDGELSQPRNPRPDKAWTVTCISRDFKSTGPMYSNLASVLAVVSVSHVPVATRKHTMHRKGQLRSTQNLLGVYSRGRHRI